MRQFKQPNQIERSLAGKADENADAGSGHKGRRRDGDESIRRRSEIK
jgi:hypothetical protein